MAESDRSVLPGESSGSIDEDLCCRSCGYNLRGLPRQSYCPECHTPISESVPTDLLIHADPGWLRTVHKGIVVCVWKFLLAVVTYPTIGVLLLTRAITPQAILITGLLLGLLGLWAIVLVTAQEPRVALREPALSLRRVIRVCAVLDFVLIVLEHSPAVQAPAAAAPIGMFKLAAAAIVLIGVLVYLRRLSQRIPHPGLIRSTTILIWGWSISYGVVAIGRIVMTIHAYLNSGGSPGGAAPTTTAVTTAGPAVFGAFMCFSSLAWFVLGLWTLFTLDRFRREFNTIIAEAAPLAAA